MRCNCQTVYGPKIDCLYDLSNRTDGEAVFSDRISLSNRTDREAVFSDRISLSILDMAEFSVFGAAFFYFERFFPFFFVCLFLFCFVFVFTFLTNVLSF